MKFYPIESELSIQKGATHCLEIGYADLTAAGNTQTIAGPTIPLGYGFELVDTELATPFVSSDATLISTAITVGDAGSANRYQTSTEWNAAGAYVKVKGPAQANNALPYLMAADTAVNVYVTGTAAKLLNTHTAGRAFIFCKLTQAFPDQGNQPGNYPSL
jgi:hypothetical protein